MGDKIRVLIVDDSAFMRKVIGDILASDDRIEVVGKARDGKDALRKIEQIQPDVITLDVEMPVMDGLEALEHIMRDQPTPVIMISSLTEEGASKTLQAISTGAIDFITKPSALNSLDFKKIEKEMISKVVTASKVNVNRVTRGASLRPKQKQEEGDHHTIVAIGTSTGGPRALQEIITYLPAHIPASFLIVQHMPAGFTKSLADRLNTLSAIKVKEAEEGEEILAGTAYIAPGNYHMQVKEEGSRRFISLNQREPVNNHRPSVDVLFQSLAKLRAVNKIGVILTGMGRDGAVGVERLKQSSPKSIILAESKDSAVVYGMPKAAIETNQVDEILPIEAMGKSLKKLINDMRRE